MKTYVALLRAVNVGGTGMLAMKELAELASRAGFQNVRTYIQSGNLLMDSKLSKTQTQKVLSEALRAKMGREVGVMIRTPEELDSVLSANPFTKEPGNKVAIVFLPKAMDVKNLEGPAGEQVRAHGAEIFIHYPDGMGKSKLKVPATAQGTARNVNTVRKLMELCKAIPRTVKGRHER